MDAYIVTWRDTVTRDGWQELHEISQLTVATVKTVGFLINETKDSITLAGDYDPDEDGYNRVITIPKDWVIAKKKIKLK